jgi:GDPmannose 4,6-dehydratase
LSFVTRKITDAVARIELGLASTLELGNLEARRDWGYAKEYVEGVWRTLQADAPGDFVFASGRSTTVRDFASMAFKAAGIDLEWRGRGEEEVGYCGRAGRALVRINRVFFRPAEVDFLCGDSNKASSVLGWRPETTLDAICAMMLESDRQRVSKGDRT